MQIKLKRGDFVIIFLVLLLAVAVVLPMQANSDILYAEIWQDDALTERVQLTEQTDQTITLDRHNTIELKGKTAAITQADCPDQVCVRTGVLTKAGQTAVCLPNRVILKLVGKNAEVDAIVT